MQAVKKDIPWQKRDLLGNVPAFFLTDAEALLAPIDYYEKLRIHSAYQEPFLLCFFNAFYLTAPLIPSIFSWAFFLGIIFILIVTLALLVILAFAMTKILSFFIGQENYAKNFYVLAYATPAFVFSCIPKMGFLLSACVGIVLTSAGLTQVYKNSFWKILPALFLVPIFVVTPNATILFLQNWQKQHPAIDIQTQAQQTLAAISNAAENYALSHEGMYPTDSAVLAMPPVQYLTRDYCGATVNNYSFSCDLRSVGYLLVAKPQGFQGRGKKVFYVTTGGKLWSQ